MSWNIQKPGDYINGPLTVTGSATITGDLTVDTSTLKVDSANDRVGIGTASPSYLLDILATGASTATSSFAMARITGASAVANDLTLIGPNTSQVRINFGDVDASSVGEIGYDHSTNRMRFVVSGNEQYRIDPSGVFTWLDGAGGTRMTLNSTGLGVGVTPSAWSGYGLPVIETPDNGTFIAAGPNAYFGANWYWNGGFKYRTSNTANYFQINTGTFKWYTAPSGTAGNAITFTQAMTLDASGNLSVGATAVLNSVRIFCQRSGGSVAGFNRTTSDGTNVLFYREGLIVGDVSVTTTGTTFNSTSDYRLKDSVAPLSGGLARVNSLKPSIYKWKSNGSDGEGFLAHELAEVVPAAVSGQKDAVNEDGTIKAQSIDMSRIVPILVAAIQELTARVQTLEAR
jgi:hypothetical protein